MKKRSCSWTGLLLMTVASRAQYSMPPGGVVSIGLPEIETNLFGLGLPALGGGVQQAGRFQPVGVGDGAHGLAVQVVAAVAAMVEEGQQIAVPARVVGQRPAQQDGIDLRPALEHVGVNAELQRPKGVVVFWEGFGKAVHQLPV